MIETIRIQISYSNIIMIDIMIIRKVKKKKNSFIIREENTA